MSISWRCFQRRSLSPRLFSADFSTWSGHSGCSFLGLCCWRSRGRRHQGKIRELIVRLHQWRVLKRVSKGSYVDWLSLDSGWMDTWIYIRCVDFTARGVVLYLWVLIVHCNGALRAAAAASDRPPSSPSRRAGFGARGAARRSSSTRAGGHRILTGFWYRVRKSL